MRLSKPRAVSNKYVSFPLYTLVYFRRPLISCPWPDFREAPSRFSILFTELQTIHRREVLAAVNEVSLCA